MSERMIGWGIVGIGTHANIRMAPAFVRAPNSRLVAVCSRDAQRAASFAAKHGAEESYDSYEALLANPAVDVVYVATPHSLHREYVLRAAEAGKHVMCEKPMALTVPDAQSMVETCRRAGVMLGVCFQGRQHPAHVEARRLVAVGRIGDVLMVRAQYASFSTANWEGWRADPAVGGAGTLMGLGLHPLDQIRFVTGQEPVEVTAMMDTPDPDRTVDLDVALLLRLSNGAFAVVNSSRRLPRAHNDLTVYGSKARVSTQGTVGMQFRGSLEVVGDDISLHAEYPDPDPVTGLYAAMIRDFSASVLEGRAPAATGEDGLAMTRLAEAVLQSVRQGRAVRL